MRSAIATLHGVSSLLKTVAIMTTVRCSEQRAVVIIATVFSNEARLLIDIVCHKCKKTTFIKRL